MGVIDDKMKETLAGSSPKKEEPKEEKEKPLTLREVMEFKEREKAIEMMKGSPPPPPPQPSPIDIKASFDIGKLIENSQQMLKSAYEKAQETQNKDMLGYLGAISEKLKQVAELQSTPRTQKGELDTYREVRALMDEVAVDLKKNMGVQTPVSASDTPALLALEEKKIDREDRQRQHLERMKQMDQQHEEKMAETRRQWQVEDKKFEKTFLLDKMKLETEGGFKGRATNAIEDVAGSIVDSITKARGGEAKHTFETECPDCGTKLSVEKGQKEAKCPKCGATHEVTW